MWVQLLSVAILFADVAYHRWFDTEPAEKRKPHSFSIARTDDGAPVPIIYGQCRVRAPILAWCYVAFINSPDTTINALFVLGMTMDDGKGVNRVHNMWEGDTKLALAAPLTAGWGVQTGAGGPETEIQISSRGQVETLNGNASQVLASPGDTNEVGAQPAPTWAGRKMLSRMTAENISGYRGYLCVFLHNGVSSGWAVAGPNTGAEALPAYSFEASSYRDGGGYPAVGIYATVGPDCNPINALYDLLTSKRGKLNIPRSLIDMPSFQAAASTLSLESHGYSRSIEDSRDADSHIQEILAQIDAALYADEVSNTVKVRLIRPDYDPTTIPEITRNNCERLTNFVASGWTNIINRVRIVYPNREKDYADDSEIAQNPANAIGVSDEVNEQVIEMPGVCYQALAARIAARELAARSRPLIKCRALVGRDFLRVYPGDAIKLTWRNPDISGLIFRVARVDRGALDDSRIALDLIQDFNYVYRNHPPRAPHFGIGDDLQVGLR